MTDANVFMTHWFGCWRDHHDCAIAMVEKAVPFVSRRVPWSEKARNWIRMYGDSQPLSTIESTGETKDG